MTRGPVYDNAVRLLATTDLVALLHRLGIRADPDSIRLSEALPASTLYADLLVRTGPRRLDHVEFVRAPARDLPDRMLEYRTRILRREPGTTVRQHILVLADGTVPEHLTDGVTAHDVDVVYLRDHDAGAFLARPGTAPLAVLAGPGTGRTRADVLRAALVVIARTADGARRHQLTETALVLAAIHLDTPTIEATTREALMSFTLDDTPLFRDITARAEAKGLARGEAKGLALGEAKGLALGEASGRARVLAALLRRRFGADPRIDTVVPGLAALPQEQAVELALTCADLADLADLPDLPDPADGAGPGR